MRAMALAEPAPIDTDPLRLVDMPVPEPGPGQILVRVEVCGVCRTDLHIAEGELPPHRPHVVPGHEVVGTIAAHGSGTGRLPLGTRVGVAWLHATDGTCPYCLRGDENLCVAPTFTGYDVNGGYAEHLTVPEDFAYPLPETLAARPTAPLLCAGIIGYRALRRSSVEPGQPLGLYGFGGSAHIVIQIARHWGCPVYVCTRGERNQQLARDLGAEWVGGADAVPPVKLRAAILFAPVGHLVPVALQALDRGGTLACADIYMTPIPEMDYDRCLFQERDLRSVTANTRRDGEELLRLAAEIPLTTHTEEYLLEGANRALQDLKYGRFSGAAVLRVS